MGLTGWPGWPVHGPAHHRFRGSRIDRAPGSGVAGRQRHHPSPGAGWLGLPRLWLLHYALPTPTRYVPLRLSTLQRPPAPLALMPLPAAVWPPQRGGNTPPADLLPVLPHRASAPFPALPGGGTRHRETGQTPHGNTPDTTARAMPLQRRVPPSRYLSGPL